GLIVSGRDVEEVVRVRRRSARQLVQSRVDQPEPVTTVDLVRDPDEPRPFGAGERGAADVVPARAARTRAADKPALSARRQRDVDEGPGAGTRLGRDVRDPARGADRGAACRQRALVARLREDMAEAAAGGDPADLGDTRIAEVGWIASGEIGRATRLNSSHDQISYAVFCLKKKKMKTCLTKMKQLLSSRLSAETYLTV